MYDYMSMGKTWEDIYKIVNMLGELICLEKRREEGRIQEKNWKVLGTQLRLQKNFHGNSILTGGEILKQYHNST